VCRDPAAAAGRRALRPPRRTLSPNSGIAGIYEPGARLDTDAARAAVEGAFEPWERGTAICSGPLTAALAPAGTGAAEHGNVVCLLAGRIHNLDRLARELGCAPDLPAAHVLAIGYALHGEELLGKLRGSFIFVLWDRDRRAGIVAQDQLANRTLYYASAGRRLFFASDVGPLLRLLPRRPGPDPVALVHWIGNSSPPDPLTLYEGVLKVGSGHLLRLERDRWERASYWLPRYRPPSRRPRAEIVDGLWSGLVDAIAIRAQRGERIGIVMSGGIDSAAVAAAATAVGGHEPGDLRGYSAVFPDLPRVDESQRIDVLTEALGLPSVQLEPHLGGSYALSLEYLRRWELPLSGAGYVLERPLITHAAADGVTTLLDGQGGDELFGFSPYLVADRIRRGRLFSSLRLARSFPNLGHRPPWRHTIRLWRRFGLKAALPYSFHQLVRRRHQLAPSYLNQASADLFLASDNSWLWKQSPDGPLWWTYKLGVLTRERAEVGLAEYLRHRAAMGGLEARLPLMDLDLVEFSLTVPPERDFDQRLDRPLIREAMKNSVPDEIRLSPFKSNLAPYYHQGVAERDLPHVRRLLLARDAEVYRYVDAGFVREQLERPPRVGEPGWMRWLAPVWALLTAETWLRYQSDPDSVERLLAEGLPQPAWRVHRAPP
jgi:asparagine synthase (glutamine-hydrolysing)